MAAGARVGDDLLNARPRTLWHRQLLRGDLVKHPWHWGIAVVAAPGAVGPETLDGSLVTATAEALVIKVQHTQDIDAELFEGDWERPTAMIRARDVADLEDAVETVIDEGGPPAA